VLRFEEAGGRGKEKKKEKREGVIEGGVFSNHFLRSEHIQKETPPGGGVLSIKKALSYSCCARQCFAGYDVYIVFSYSL